MQATSHERWDTSLTETVPTVRRGLFGRTFTSYSRGVPHWYGHCNGWTSASIRHAEPVNSVVRNGVTFTPADIKGLLAELYIYNEMDVLAGSDSWLNPATLHAILTNWVGRGNHPMGMEADPGKEKWNYPIFAYASTSARRSNGQIEVKMNVAYAKDSRGEFQQSPRNKAQKYFHYALNVDENGMITGGSFYGDSSRIDMLWIPLSPKESKTPGHERGNPYITVKDIVSIWRDSVPAETRAKWFTIDPLVEDRIDAIPEGLTKLIPLQKFEVAQPAEPAANAVAATTTEATPAVPAADATAAAPATAEPSTAPTTTETAASPPATEAAPGAAASEAPAETETAPAVEASGTETNAGE